MSEIDDEYGGSLYFLEFKFILEEKQANLDLDDFIHGIKVLNSVVDINKAIDTCCANLADSEDLEGESNYLFEALQRQNAHIQELNEYKGMKQRYLTSLVSSKQYKNNSLNSSDLKNLSSSTDSGHNESELFQCSLLTHGEIQDCVIQTNAEYEQECLGNFFTTNLPIHLLKI